MPPASIAKLLATCCSRVLDMPPAGAPNSNDADGGLGDAEGVTVDAQQVVY